MSRQALNLTTRGIFSMSALYNDRFLADPGEETKLTPDGDLEPDVSFVSKDTGKQTKMNLVCSSIRKRHRETLFIFLGVYLVVNIIVIVLSISILSGTLGKGVGYQLKKKREVLAPLCVPCQYRIDAEQEEEKEEEGWRRYKNGDSGQDLCCPLDYHHAVTALGQIYETVRSEKQKELLADLPANRTVSFLELLGEPVDTEDVMLLTNRYKPCAHVTGTQPSDTSKHEQKEGDVMQTVDDWPLREQMYRSLTSGYVQRLFWGLEVPVSGIYRAYAYINFYFPYPDNSKHSQHDEIEQTAVVHQVSRYHAKTGHISILAERNETIGPSYYDGLASFLVTLTYLDIGDVIFMSVSKHAALSMQDHWQGLFLVN